MKLTLKYKKLYINIDTDCTTDMILEQLYQSKKNRYLLYQEGKISISKETIKQNTAVKKGDIVCIQLPEVEDDIEPDFTPIDICYEDDIFLAVNKPSTLLVHSDGTNTAHTLSNRVKAYYMQQGYQIPVRPLHRLDIETSGQVLFCKIPFFQPMLDTMLKDKKIHREYIALLQGHLPRNHMTINKPIGRDRHNAKKMRISNTGTPACTDVKPIKKNKNFSMVHCILHTGRTHQIRVHLSSIQHPLLSDPLYGTKDTRIQRLALRAFRLKFYHPILQKELCVECTMPADITKVIQQGS